MKIILAIMLSALLALGGAVVHETDRIIEEGKTRNDTINKMFDGAHGINDNE